MTEEQLKRAAEIHSEIRFLERCGGCAPIGIKPEMHPPANLHMRIIDSIYKSWDAFRDCELARLKEEAEKL